MMKKIPKEFYIKDAIDLAPALIDKLLCRNINGEVIKHRITETECYMQYDTACHANKGKTARNSVMFDCGGVAYVYLCYGIHNLLNIVSGKENDAQAVLIRGVEGYNGPGKLTKAMMIDRTLNGADLTGDTLWLEDDGVQVPYKTSPRIGIDYADEIDKLREWNFTADY